MRLLAPREEPIAPARIDLHTYFTDAEIARGARFARPQLVLGLTRAAIELSALASVVRRPPRWLSRPVKRPVVAGAGAGAGLAVGLSVPALPLRAVSRRRGIAVGLVTQSWRGWAADLVKSAGIEAVLAGGAGAAVGRGHPALSAGVVAAGVGGLGAVRRRAGGTRARSCSTRCSTTSRRCPRARRALTCSSWRAPRASRWGRCTRWTPAGGPPPPTPTWPDSGRPSGVVLFDTLLDRYSRDEIRVVVAHELAHVRNRDVPRGWCSPRWWRRPPRSPCSALSWALSRERGTPGALPALALAAASFVRRSG